MADVVVPAGEVVAPERPKLTVPQLPGLIRRGLAGSWPETEVAVGKVVEWLPQEAEFRARQGLGWAKAKADKVFEDAPGQIVTGRAWLTKTLDDGWKAAKAWVREYLGLKPEKPPK